MARSTPARLTLSILVAALASSAPVGMTACAEDSGWPPTASASLPDVAPAPSSNRFT
jgi:hypothetical protein